jgi:hypothetical protein
MQATPRQTRKFMSKGPVVSHAWAMAVWYGICLPRKAPVLRSGSAENLTPFRRNSFG